MTSERRVTPIPAMHTLGPRVAAQAERRRVAAYARVSTELEEQQNSYEMQIRYYTQLIQAHDEWEFAGMYADEGISGTQTKHRPSFQKMVEDALAGRIDLILTKSVSRFARNTVDSLITIRRLKEANVEVFFEKENIYSFDGKGELLLTLMSSLAQEESRSISENTKWGHRRMFQSGRYSVPYSHFLGFDRGPDGRLLINPHEAQIVRLIFRLYLEGLNPSEVARQLTAQQILTPTGREIWNFHTIDGILSNEKYRGDALLQKCYTADFITHRVVKNEGQLPQYYIENDHEAIIDPDIFDLVQVERLRRKADGHRRKSAADPYAGMIQCQECQRWYGAKRWHSTSPYARTVYQCNGHAAHHCTTRRLEIADIQESFLLALSKLLTCPPTEELASLRLSLVEQSTLPLRRLELQEELKDPDRTRSYDAIQRDLNLVNVDLFQKRASLRSLDALELWMHEHEDQALPSFSTSLWHSMVERLRVYPDRSIGVLLHCGYEVRVTEGELAEAREKSNS